MHNFYLAANARNHARTPSHEERNCISLLSLQRLQVHAFEKKG